MSANSQFTDRDVLAARGPKLPNDPWQPLATLIEPERQADGQVRDVVTLFLANRECPFRCVFCDLWQRTLDEPTPPGAVPRQIDVAFERLPAEQLANARVVKLYNSGNFFDAAAIPPEDWPAIADRVRRFDLVIVENHPRLIDDRVLRFRDLIGTRLEVAMGLETIHPDVLPRLNKHMTLDEFARAVRFLIEHDIAVRAFVLLRPPFMTEAEGIEWAVKSVEFAFDLGVNCCSIIPTRGGNGALDRLRSEGQFAEPRLTSLEQVAEQCLSACSPSPCGSADSAFISDQTGHNGQGYRPRGRVFVDLWDAERFAECPTCVAARIERLRTLNLTQTVSAPVPCGCQ